MRVTPRGVALRDDCGDLGVSGENEGSREIGVRDAWERNEDCGGEPGTECSDNCSVSRCAIAAARSIASSSIAVSTARPAIDDKWDDSSDNMEVAAGRRAG